MSLLLHYSLSSDFAQPQHSKIGSCNFGYRIYTDAHCHRPSHTNLNALNNAAARNHKFIIYSRVCGSIECRDLKSMPMSETMGNDIVYVQCARSRICSVACNTFYLLIDHMNETRTMTKEAHKKNI